MSYFVATALSFLLQLFLIFAGVDFLGKYVNPVFLFAVSLTIPALVFVGTKKADKDIPDGRASRLGVLLAFAALAAFLVFEYYQGFRYYDQPEKYSDVIPQLEVLFTRYAAGEQPYYPLPLSGYAPFPVYMPAHWIPLGVALIAGFDTRWIGMAFLLLATLLFVVMLIRLNASLAKGITAVVLLLLPLSVYYKWGYIDQFVSIETIVAAYYMILAAGLYFKKLWLTVAGIVLCLLSRYTLVFWLPLFAYMLLVEKGMKKSLVVWGSVVLSVLLFYVFPFLLKAPSILIDGVHYHNDAAIAEWQGYEPNNTSWTFEAGLYFAQHMKDFFSGSVADRLFKARIVQGSLMILLCIGGGWCYRKQPQRDLYSFGLVSLYVFLICFYIVGPLTYRYYFITPLALSSVLCIRMLYRRRVAKEAA